MSYEGNIKCDKCGAEHELYKQKIPMRDKDSEICRVCGNELISWNGGVMYSVKLIQNADKVNNK